LRKQKPKFHFDEAAADRAAEFFPLFMRHTKGPMAGKPFELLPWQSQIVRDLFGWKRSDGTRKYRIAYIEVPRKNGKSAFAAGLALMLLLTDGEQGGEIYSAAHTRDQAAVVYQMAASMARKDPDIAARVKVRDSRNRIMHPESDSYYRAIPSDPESAHGANPSGIIFDELHTQTSRDLWDVLQTGTGARTQPLTIAITTAGHDRSSICWELHQRAEAVLAGDLDDPSFYPVVFSADREADWTDEAVWKAANPSIGHAVSVEYLRDQCQRAQDSPAFENTFRNLHLNQWTEQAVRWMPMHAWDACKSETVPDLAGCRCWAGLDIASTRDVTALVLLFEIERGQYWVQPHFWIPKNSIDRRSEQDRRQVLNWAAQGHLTQTDGPHSGVVDYTQIAAEMVELFRDYDVQSVAYDPYGSAHFLVQHVHDDGHQDINFESFKQTIWNYSLPTKRFAELITTGQLQHDGDPVLRWMASNVVVKSDVNDNVRPDKGKSQDKIDGIVAAIMALGISSQDATQAGTAYDTGEVVLAL